MNKTIASLLTGAAIGLGAATSVQAATINLTVVDSLNTPSPFGVLYDGSNVWFSQGVGGNQIFELNQSNMTLTGATRTLTGGGTGAMAWDGTHFVSTSGPTIFYFNATTGALASSLSLTGGAGGGLIDGLDIDHGRIYWSPDVSVIQVFNATTGAFIEQLNYPPNSGFSGIERVDVANGSFGIYVNDAFNPRRLCVGDLAGNQIGCATLANDRYEDLAFDGRYIYAADLFGNKVDKVDLCIDTGNGCNSIFEPPGRVPEPGSLSLLAAALFGFGVLQHRRRRK